LKFSTVNNAYVNNDNQTCGKKFSSTIRLSQTLDIKQVDLNPHNNLIPINKQDLGFVLTSSRGLSGYKPTLRLMVDNDPSSIVVAADFFFSTGGRLGGAGLLAAGNAVFFTSLLPVVLSFISFITVLQLLDSVDKRKSIKRPNYYTQ